MEDSDGKPIVIGSGDSTPQGKQYFKDGKFPFIRTVTLNQLIKPAALKKGDFVATISLSWGGAEAFPQRYAQGKRQFEDAFGIKIIETPHALATSEELYNHPEWRLEDLMWAFQNTDVKAVLCNIGGDDTIRLLRLMNTKHFEIIRNNPKIFLGISDTTVNHFMCLKAGISSFYSASTLFGYAENGGIPSLMVNNTKKILFNIKPIGILPESKDFIIDKVNWGDERVVRPRTPSTPWRYIQGEKSVRGRLIGGCLDILDFINGTTIWPQLFDWENAILFIETSEDQPSPDQVLYWLRNFATQGIFDHLVGILFGRPGGEFENKEDKKRYIKQSFEYDKAILKVLKEYNREDMPVVTNMDFGHTVPQLILPFGVLTEINPNTKEISILEGAVI